MDEERENYVQALEKMFRTPLCDISATDARQVVDQVVTRREKVTEVPVSRFGSSI